MKRAFAIAAGSLMLAGSAGFLASQALTAAPSQPTRTVTITLRNGATGPAGPRGPTGPSGAQTCPSGYELGLLTINHPGGQVTILTCLRRG